MLNFKARKGSVLAYILIVVSIVAIILSSAIQFIVSRVKYSAYTHAREEAFQISEAGIQYFRWYLAHNTDGRTALQIQDFWNNRSLLPAEEGGMEYRDPNGGAIGKFKLEVIPPDAGSTIAIVRSEGWTYKYPDHKREIQVRLRRPSWSEFILMINDDLRVGEGTETFGKVKSNFGIRFDGLAHNLVSSAVYKYDDPDHAGSGEYGVHTHLSPVDPLPDNPLPARTDVFEAGRQIDVTDTDFVGMRADLNLIESVARSGLNGSIFLNDDFAGWHIILKEDGTFDYCNIQNFQGENREVHKYRGSWRNAPIPESGVIFVQNNVRVEGKINNDRLTIVAADLKTGGSRYDIYLKNDLTYTNYDGRDVLGLVADGNIEVILNSENDLRIDAAMIAQEGKVGRGQHTPWWCFSSSCRDIKDTITVYGAIASNIRYGFAYTDGSGYQKRDLIFDNNLLYNPPPYFPTGSEYLLDLWEEL